VIEAPPPDTPVTVPEPFTVAMPVLLLDHDPPPGDADKLIVAPTQTFVGPEKLIVGAGFTVTVIELELEVHDPLEACRK
jgi:hypothetical protein